MPTNDTNLPDRVMHLEILLTHLERRVADLSDVLLENARRHDELERQLRTLIQRQQQLDEHVPDDSFDDEAS
jgi:uncharacterized coiled-coil protein SlyX